MEQQLNDLIGQILTENQKLVYIAIKQRAKFEGWLKFELAYKLSCYYNDLMVEYPYSKNKNQHADIFANGAFIELKTPNTNYRDNECIPCIRPVTKNILSIIGDINKLRETDDSHKKYIVFVLFPIDCDGKYKKHIERIEQEGNVTIICNTINVNSISVLVGSAEVY